MRTRLYIVLASLLVYGFLLVLLIWNYSELLVAFLSEHPVAVLGILAFSVLSTGLIWLRLRHLAEIRSWLVLKVVGNLIFISAIAAAWLLETRIEVMFLTILLAFVFWASALGRLISAYRRREKHADSEES